MTLHTGVISMSLNSPGEELGNKITPTLLHFDNCREVRTPYLAIVYKIILRMSVRFRIKVCDTGIKSHK